MKKKYYLIGFFLLLGIIIGYHFYAASQAEQQIDKAIQEQAENTNNLSVQYSSIDVAPFGGSVTIRDLNIIFGTSIERAQTLNLDISYFDFLNIYIGGLPYGLDRLTQADITAVRASYVNRDGLEEIKADSMHVTYTGNALDGIQNAVNGNGFSHTQTFEARSAGLTISLPKTDISKLKASELRYSGRFPTGKRNVWYGGNHQFALDSLTWTPSKAFQSNYQFFIKGFGYPTDAIPLQSIHLHSKPTNKANTLRIETTIKSELARLSSSGYIQLENPVGNSKFENLKVTLTEFSDSFSRVLENIERLLSISLPRTDNGITLKIKGTLSNPSIAK